jgi:A/G-specific adenine glycosylase
MEAGISPTAARALQRAILDFFDTHARALPWRATDDPYRIWISEVMLQQTRVDTVIPYYERWLERFPDIDRLADADAEEVLRAWAGLGYYTRARHLHHAARVVRERHAGALPRTAAELRTLPGVGEYTAGALASIAFAERASAVDGNVRRVLSRLLDADLTPAALRNAADSLVPADRPGDFNQGMMELGATVCTPRRPACGECPVRAHCRAAAVGTQHLRPARRTRPAVPELDLLTLVLHCPAGVLLTRRPDGLLAGMWRFPAIPLEGDVIAAARTAIRRLAGGRSPRLHSHGVVSHTFSHRREHYHVVAARLRRPFVSDGGDESRWCDPAELHALPLPAAQRRIAALATSSGETA